MKTKQECLRERSVVLLKHLNPGIWKGQGKCTVPIKGTWRGPEEPRWDSGTQRRGREVSLCPPNEFGVCAKPAKVIINFTVTWCGAGSSLGRGGNLSKDKRTGLGKKEIGGMFHSTQ